MSGHEIESEVGLCTDQRVTRSKTIYRLALFPTLNCASSSSRIVINHSFKVILAFVQQRESVKGHFVVFVPMLGNRQRGAVYSRSGTHRSLTCFHRLS